MISFITSLYKSEKYLKTYLSAIDRFAKNISGKEIDFEIIIISNNTSRKEEDLLRSAESNWFRVLKVELEGLYASWNRGISLAHGDYIAFWNVDDIRYANAVVDGIKLLQKESSLVYFPFWYKRYIRIAGINVLAKKKLIIPPKFDRKEFTESMHCGPFFMFSKDFYEKVGPFDESFKIAGDFEWCVRAAQVSNFIKSNEIGGEFKNNGRSLSGGRNFLHIEENDRIYKKFSVFDKLSKK